MPVFPQSDCRTVAKGPGRSTRGEIGGEKHISRSLLSHYSMQICPSAGPVAIGPQRTTGATDPQAAPVGPAAVLRFEKPIFAASVCNLWQFLLRCHSHPFSFLGQRKKERKKSGRRPIRELFIYAKNSHSEQCTQPESLFLMTLSTLFIAIAHTHEP